MALATAGIRFIAQDLSKAGFASFQSRLGGITRSLLAMAGAGGIGYMIKQQMEAVDVTAKLSDRLGVSTKALIALQYAAKMTGIEQGGMNAALEKFNRTLGEAQMRSAPAQKAFTQIGLSFRDLAGLSLDQQIGLIADQINKLGTQSQKAAAIQDIFGRGSEELLNLFQQGSRGIAAYRLETEKLGLAFSRVDAAQIEAANDALTRMRAVFTGLFRQTAIELAPYIEAAASSFVDWATAGEGVGKNVTAVFESVTLAIAQTIEETERLIMKLGQIGSPLDYMKKVSEANKRAIEQYRSTTGDIGAFRYTLGPLGPPTQPRDPYMWEVVQNVQKQAAGLEPMSRESQVRAAFDKIRREAQERAVSVPRAGAIDISPSALEKIAAMNRYMAAQKPPAEEPSKRMQTLMQQVDQEIALLGRLSEPRQHARMMIEYQAEAAKTYGANTQAAARATETFAVQLKKLEVAETWAQLADTMANSMADGFERMTFEAQKFGDFMKQLGRDLLKEFMRLMIFRPMAQGITGGLSSLFAPSARGNVFERGRLVPMAAGGVVSGPTVFPMAGEAGPEAFFPLIRKGGRLAVEGSSSTPNIVINNNSGVPIKQAGPPRFNDGQWVVGLVVEDFIRGGAIKNMIEGRGV